MSYWGFQVNRAKMCPSHRPEILLVWFGILLYGGLGGLMLIWDDPQRSTLVFIAGQVLGPHPVPEFFLLGSSALALMALLASSGPIRVLLLTPQQTLMAMSFASAVYSIMTGQFPSGIRVHSSLILANQLPLMLGAIFHTVALVLLSFEGRTGDGSDLVREKPSLDYPLDS